MTEFRAGRAAPRRTGRRPRNMLADVCARWADRAHQRLRPWNEPWTTRRIRVFWVVTRMLLIIGAVTAKLLGAQHGVLGDVRLYDHWGHGLVHGNGLPAGDDRWQYPPAAAIVLAVPSLVQMVTRLPYEVGFLLMIIVLDAVVTGVLARRSVSAARFWLVGTCALGPVSMARFDLVPAALTVAGFAELTRGRWGRTGLAVGAGTLVKVWPVLFVAALAGPGSTGGHPGLPAGRAMRPALARFAGGLVAAVALVAGVLFGAGWWRDAFGFVGAQKARGLQLEAVPATPFVLAHMVGLHDGPVYAWGSLQFGSAAARRVAGVCSLVEAAVMVGATAWWWLRRSPRTATDPADRMLALLLLIIVTSRVLSPQYLVWVLAVAACRPGWSGADGTTDPAGVAGRRALDRRITIGLLVICLISFVVYPIRYEDVVQGRVVASLLLVLRNAVLVVICWYAVRVAWRPPQPPLPRPEPFRRLPPSTQPDQPASAAAMSEQAKPARSRTAPPR
ncbi:glycosyltransferase family 87 protein [Frankia sp. Cppng1_Ct_nod]|uniref:glycosyltransferase family 87 protein n=1 Tax=Frankia sp. Cppng1_Ct_nod TaxID=2897162 RepID=UPI002025385E|nr:glycosyltransferase family 87 protein [Frankia sp. Cppng1_Ct_nod]